MTALRLTSLRAALYTSDNAFRGFTSGTAHTAETLEVTLRAKTIDDDTGAFLKARR